MSITKDCLKKFYFSDKNNGFFWNTFAGLINASEVVVLSIVTTRTNGISDAGVFTIAFAVGNLMRTIGLYGMRSFQVSDSLDKYQFLDYLQSRVVTASAMLVASIAYMLYKVFFLGYSRTKLIVTLCVCGIYVVEVFEDIFYGYYQKRNEIDVGGKTFSVRWIITLLSMSLILVLKKDIVIASIVGFIVSILHFLTFLGVAIADIKNTLLEKKKDIFKTDYFGLLKEAFPLFCVSFLTFYVINAPKYAIDRYMTDEVQACYGFIAMPVFVIELLTSFFYQPILSEISTDIGLGRLKEFKRKVGYQIMAIFACSAVCIGGAALIGIPVLSAIYNTDLSAYKNSLLILLVGGVFLALGNFFITLLTVLRNQKCVFGVYTIFSIAAFCLFNSVVRTYGVVGAASLFAAIMMAECLILGIMFVRKYKVQTNVE